MTNHSPPDPRGLLRRLRDILSRWRVPSVPSVPEELSCCEFDCRRTHCAEGDWAECSLRLEYEKRRGASPPVPPDAAGTSAEA